MVEKYCCFFGTGKSTFNIKTDMRLQLELEELIRAGVNNFIFFSTKDVFNNLCHDMISALKRDYPHLKRIAFFEKNINYDYEKFYSAEQLFENGIKKRYETVIDKSDVCIFNLDDKNKTLSKFSDENSEQAQAYKYAVKMNKEIICIF